MSSENLLTGPEGTRFSELRHVERTTSTNEVLLAQARAALAIGGSTAGSVIVADHQTAGRGRQRRRWHDEPGNAVLLSATVEPDPGWLSIVPLIGGLAVADAVDELVDPGTGPSRPVGLKWPNDLLVPSLGERKMAGILSEAVAADGRVAAVVGIGLNLRWSTTPPSEVAERAVTLEELSHRPIDRWDAVRAVLAGLERWLELVERAGPAPALEQYRRRCLTLGRDVRFVTPSALVEGQAVGVDPNGALVVDTGTSQVTLTAGDAHHV